MRSLLKLSVFLVLINEDSGKKPVVYLQPRFPQVYVGDDVTLICRGGKKPTTWIFNKNIQSHQNYLLLLTSVTPHNNGQYECEQNGEKSDPVTLTVLVLEALAQLSLTVGGAVITRGDGRNLVLQVDDPEELDNWRCFAFRGDSGFKFDQIDVNKKIKRAVVFAQLKTAERATFWCLNKNSTHRSNAVTLKMTDKLVMLEPPAAPALQGDPVAIRCVAWGTEKVEKATFYKNKTEINNIKGDTYTIIAKHEDSGKYHCHATYKYRYSHMTTENQGDSDAQEIKVIDGPPAAKMSVSENTLECSCPKCSDVCKTYYWYYTPFNDVYNRRRLSEYKKTIYAKEVGNYCCRMNCGKGFSRFSQLYSHKVQSELVNLWPIMLGLFLLVLGLLIVLLFVVKHRRQGESSIQAAKDKDKTTGGDYEQIQLKDTAVYHTLGEGKDKAEGEYEPLKKTQEETVYHTLGSGEGQSQGEGGYQGLESVKAEVYQTLSSGEGRSQGEGGYQGLDSVKAEVYQTLSSDASKNPEGEADKGYEQLSQKAGEVLTVEENPYEELKADKLKKKPSKETE